MIWKIVYTIYPPVIRLLEKLGIHNYRCNYRLGFLNTKYAAGNLRTYLVENGFESAVLAWKDPGEILSLRKRMGKFQYHIRLFNDSEIRAHYEFAPEESPLGHIFVKHFVPEQDFFKSLLKEYLIDSTSSTPQVSGSN